MNIDWLLEPFEFTFMVRAFMGTSLVALLSAVVGTFIVLKGLSFIGDAIAHTTFSGMAIAMLLGINLFYGALVMALLTAIGVTYLNRSTKIKNDTALAILFTGAFALGIILLSTMPTFAGDLSALLLGSVLSIGLGELYGIAGVVILVGLVLFFIFPHLVFVMFDPVGAEAAGLPVLGLQMALMVMIAISVVVSLQAVGVILVMALLITPAATASLFTKRLNHMVLLASMLGLMATWIGLYLSYYLSAPPGATVVLVATLQFGVALVYSRLRTDWRLSSKLTKVQ